VGVREGKKDVAVAVEYMRLPRGSLKIMWAPRRDAKTMKTLRKVAEDIRAPTAAAKDTWSPRGKR